VDAPTIATTPSRSSRGVIAALSGLLAAAVVALIAVWAASHANDHSGGDPVHTQAPASQDSTGNAPLPPVLPTHRRPHSSPPPDSSPPIDSATPTPTLPTPSEPTDPGGSDDPGGTDDPGGGTEMPQPQIPQMDVE
jgi:hypothetical protein